MCPSLNSQCSTGESSVEAKGSHTTTLLILQELKVVQGTTTARETGENVVPTTLTLVAVCELHMCVLEGESLFGELLEADNDVFGGSVGPAALGHHVGADLLEFRVGEDAEAAAFDVDGVSLIHQCLGCCGSQR